MSHSDEAKHKMKAGTASRKGVRKMPETILPNATDNEMQM